MKGLVGHEKALDSLPSPLPHTLLITGPEGVGKSRAAWLIGKTLTDVRGLDFQNLQSLDREASRRLIAHHSTHPLDGPVKVSVADISKSTPETINAILKLLEDPPSYSHIILTSDTDPMLTIRSRCFLLRFGTLSEEEVAQVLTRLKVGSPEDAAKYAHGRVSLGIDYAQNSATRKAVEGVLGAVLRRDASLVEATLAEALRVDYGTPHAQADAKRKVICRLLSQSIRSSLSRDEHPLSIFPLPNRLRALEILDGEARPALRARSAAWILLAG